jgi:hypothetical protein
MKRSATKTSLDEEGGKMLRIAQEIQEIEDSDEREKIIKQENQRTPQTVIKTPTQNENVLARSPQETQQIDSSQARNQLNDDIISAIEIQIITLQALVTKLKDSLAQKK